MGRRNQENESLWHGYYSNLCIWIHHEEEEGVFDFTGQRNLHRFLELCEKWQMHVWLRIGPWAHGEARNGGFPDWLLKKGYKLRSDDPDYLALVERFWKKIYKEVAGTHCILGIQVENEYGHVGGLRGAAGGATYADTNKNWQKRLVLRHLIGQRPDGAVRYLVI